MKTTRFNPFRTAMLALPLALALQGGADAAPVTKYTSGTDLTASGAWGTGSGPVPTSTDVATWSTGSLGGALTIDSALSWQGIDIQAATTAISTSGAGMLTLGSSGINIASGGVDLNLVNSVTIGAAQNWTVASGRTFTTSSGGKTLALNNALTLDGAGIVFIGGASGSTTLTGSANLNINNGRLAWGTQTSSSIAGYSGQFVLNSGGKLSINTGNTLPALTINGGTIGSFSTTARTESGALTIGGDFTIGGSETASVVGNISSGAMTFSGNANLNNGTRTITVNANTLFSGNISDGSGAGAGSIIKAGSGTLRLSGANNTVSGSYTVSAGDFVLDNIGAENGAPSLVVNGGRFILSSPFAGNTATMGSLSGAGGEITTLFNTATGIRTLSVNQTVDGTFAGTLTGETTAGSRQLALVKTGSAKLTLSGNSTYVGGTTISQGTLAAITNNTALGGAGTVTINDSNTSSNNTALLLGNVTMARAITVANQGTGTTTLGANGGAALPTFSGAITLAKDVTLDGTGNTDRLTFSGGIGGTGNVTIAGGTNRVVFVTAANTYAGTTTISTNSILQLGTGGSDTANLIPDASVLTLNNGSFLKLAKGANSETIGGLTGTGTVRGHEGVASTASAIVINNSGNHSFGGVLENGGASGSTLSVTKDGAGTQTLTNTNTYTGNTTVSNGKLIINGGISTSALTTVDSGASLGGSGTVGALTVNGTLAPGNSIESIGTGNLSFGSTSTYAYELETALYGTTPGVAGDLTYATGTLNIANGAILTLADLATSTALADGSKLTLISYTGLWNSGLFTYLGNTLADGATFTLGANEWKFDYNDTVEGVNYTGDSAGTYVTMTVVPEPGAALLGGLGLLALLRRRREA